ncbi:uncharacterized protein EHS24_008189 [Apiotrichum porosum]|uniref:Enoyl reductase (ER) domain-containing protein n=1 Tax=Apiotrichum porosum TaxID=105984 RepID=A0A427XT41_9TREE|nr:uncharacterized protein EHS24_008189 [Apiotrichum porosum]RSH81987.1 hypothetical protein EHS24_008189 [Apiotrichum porosum]
MSTASAPETFDSWVGHDVTDVVKGELKFEPVPVKPWDEDDIDVKVTHCGLCGSDFSMLAGHFFPLLPQQVCGHEIVGEVTRIGSQVKDVKVGDRVGIGAQCDGCLECEWCVKGEEQFCPQMTFTLGAPYPRGNAKGTFSHGGFAKYWRGPARFAIPIPASLDSAEAAPLLCAGATVYSPLKYYGAGPGKNIGVVGIGGLGHVAVMLAKAMGASVTVLSRGEAKRDEAKQLGADDYIPTTKDAAADVKGRERSLDFIICTINPESLPASDYMTMLKPRGTFVLLGIVPKPLELSTMGMVVGVSGIAGSQIGSPAELKELMEFAAKHKIRPWVQKCSMDNINQAMADYQAGKPKYRIVLVNTDNGGTL